MSARIRSLLNSIKLLAGKGLSSSLKINPNDSVTSGFFGCHPLLKVPVWSVKPNSFPATILRFFCSKLQGSLQLGQRNSADLGSYFPYISSMYLS